MKNLLTILTLIVLASILLAGCGAVNVLRRVTSETPGSYTVQFIVQPPIILRTDDTAFNEAGEGEIIANCVVTMVVTNEETGHSVVQTLMPMYEEDGFHYVANFSLPEDETILGSQDDGHQDDNHQDDGHAH